MNEQPNASIPSKGCSTSASPTSGFKKGCVSSSPSKKKNSVSTPRRKKDSLKQPKASIPSKGSSTSASPTSGSKKGSVSSSHLKKKNSVSTPSRKKDSLAPPGIQRKRSSKTGSRRLSPYQQHAEKGFPDAQLPAPEVATSGKGPSTGPSPYSDRSGPPVKEEDKVSAPFPLNVASQDQAKGRGPPPLAVPSKPPLPPSDDTGQNILIKMIVVLLAAVVVGLVVVLALPLLKGFAQGGSTSASSTATLPSTSSTATLPSTSSTMTLPSASSTMTLPSASSKATLPTASSTVTLPTASSTVTLPTASSTVTLPTASTTVTLPTASSTGTLPSASSAWTPPSAALCESETCQQAANQLLRGLSPSTRPCEDFYEYVCGEWKGPAYEEHELFQKFVDGVAEESRAQRIPSIRQTATEKAAMAYQSCEDIVAKNSTSMAMVKHILHAAGFFSLVTWYRPFKILNATFFLALTWRIASPFKIEFLQETEPGLIIHLGPSQSLVEYLERRQQPDWSTRSQSDFEEMQGTFQSDMEETIPYALWKKADDAVTDDWFGKLPTGESKKVSQSWDDSNIDQAVVSMSRDDWNTLLDTHFVSRTPLTFLVHSPDLFSSFAGLPSLVGHDMARPYYRWYMVEVLAGAVYAPWITRRYPDRRRALKHQRRYCFAVLEKSAGYAFLAPYVRKMFSVEVTDNIFSLLRLVRSAYGKLFARSGNFSKIVNLLPSYSTDWGHVLDFLDDANLDQRYARYDDMTSDPLENWRRLRIGLTESFAGDVTMDAPGDVINHLRFYIPANPHKDFILRPDVAVIPFFDPLMPAVLQLAGLGSIMASAMIDAVYAAKNMWTDGDRETWKQSSSCIRNSVFPADSSEEDDLLKRTLALATVVLAQQKFLESEFSAIVLKDLPELSGTQLLFVAWCHLECGKTSASKRCNVPVRDLPSFAEAFKCNADAPTRANALCTHGLLEM